MISVDFIIRKLLEGGQEEPIKNWLQNEAKKEFLAKFNAESLTEYTAWGWMDYIVTTFFECCDKKFKSCEKNDRIKQDLINDLDNNSIFLIDLGILKLAKHQSKTYSQALSIVGNLCMDAQKQSIDENAQPDGFFTPK